MIDKIAGPVFILGCERSGSTWVSNVLDAHKDIEFYMEPFADYAQLFPGFPNRNLYLEANNDSLVDLIREKYGQLSKKKYALIYKPGRNVMYKYVDHSVLMFFGMIVAIFKCRLPIVVQQFQSLNLNLLKIPVSQQSRKNKLPLVVATKDLRLNLKIGLLKKAFPDVKVLIIVRNPGAQITSILNLFAKGGLDELRRSLLTFFDYIKSNSRFEKYHSLIDKLSIQDDLFHKLILWWLVNYEILIEDCHKYRVDFIVVYHEEISESACAEFDKIMSFIGMEIDSDVKKYLAVSTSAKKSAVSSPVDTIRNSRVYYKEAIAKVDGQLKENIRQIQYDVDISRELYRYFQ